MGTLLGPGAFSRKLTGWQQAQLARERYRAQREDFEAAKSLVADGVAAASTNQIDQSAKITVQVALDRITASVKAKADKASASSPSPAVKEQPTTIYAGGSEIDLAAGTLTLAGGTKIDIRTGVSKIA